LSADSSFSFGLKIGAIPAHRQECSWATAHFQPKPFVPVVREIHGLVSHR
jgi:hypothetical protein